MAPIWKDYYVTLTSVTGGTPYRILCDGSVIFTGKAFASPGAAAPEVRINDICANFLTKTFPLGGNDISFKEFTVEEETGSGWTEVDAVIFYRDWSYDFSLSENYGDWEDGTNFPIVDYLHPYQYAFLTVGEVKNREDFVGDISYWDGTDWNDVLQDCFSQPDRTCTAVLNIEEVRSKYGDDVLLQWKNGAEMKIADLCGGYVLYYINAYGGWDTLLVTGKAVRTDNYTRYTRDIVYNNSTTQARGTEEYVNEIAVGWQLSIANLTAGQASRMHHLIGSTFVYLHDIDRDEIHPVTIEESSLEHKVDSHKLHTYTFRVKLAQERLRR